MSGLNKEKFFFFSKDASDIKIVPGTVEHAYLNILNNDLKTAELIFSNIDSPRGKWGVSFVSILNGFLKIYPTYFGIRNFLEIDLDFLLKNKKIDFVEQCLGALEFLSNINQETFKFAARVMLENHLYSSAVKYMERSKQIYYNDPELHYMYAKYYMSINNISNAYYYTNECLKFIPSYYPAIKMKQIIEELQF